MIRGTTAEAREGTCLSPQAGSQMAQGQGTAFRTPKPTDFTVMLSTVGTEIPQTRTRTSQRKEDNQVKEPFQEDQTEGTKWNAGWSAAPQALNIVPTRLVFMGPAPPSYPVSPGYHQESLARQRGTKSYPQR